MNKSPQVIGFGINNKETFNQATQFAKGAIIGSAFIQDLTKTELEKLRILLKRFDKELTDIANDFIFTANSQIKHPFSALKFGIVVFYYFWKRILGHMF
jgi:hypothetical protein